MARILVSGLINLETTLRVDGFPLAYFPVTYPFFGVHTTVSGVGYNLTKALTTLGDQVNFVSLIGRDAVGELVRLQLASDGLPRDFILDSLDETAQSAILYDPSGRRQIHTDLKDIQDRDYPAEQFARALAPCGLAVLCNINFSRPFLAEARQAGKLVATDVHAIASLDDDYNRDFMRAADILFMSHERLPCPPEEWARAVQDAYGNEIVVIGLGGAGALMYVRRDRALAHVPVTHVRPVVNTVGAGDALFSCFLHYYHKTGDPYLALHRAVVFAAYKIGETGAARGFLNEDGLERIALSPPNTRSTSALDHR